ncbi:unnamed protein product [Rhizophagus irregularis]|nr:unnamed protein product [Rhizophagus irregularis]
MNDSDETLIEADEDRELNLKSLISKDNAQITLEFVQKYTINDLSEKHSKQISRNQLKYGTLLGKVKKAIQFAIKDGYDELLQFIKKFNRRKEAQQA